MRIYDDFCINGSGTKELALELASVSKGTKTLELKARDLRVMSLAKYDIESETYMFQSFFMRWDKTRGRFVPDHMGDTLKKSDFLAIGGDEKIGEELRSGSRMMLEIAGEKFFVNPHFLKTYMQRGGSNPGDYAKSLDLYCRITRDYGVMAFLAATNPELKMSLLYREDEDTHARKAFALFSETGTYVPQVNFYGTVSKEFQKHYGELSVPDYCITQEKTSVYAEFPDKGASYKVHFPKVPDECVPGIIFQTSDIGLSSIVVAGTMRLGKGEFFVLPKSEVKHPHKGYVSTVSVVEDCRKEIIHIDDPDSSSYVSTMERLSDLMSIRVPSDRVPDAIKKVLVRSGLSKTLGSKRSARLATDVVSQLGKVLSSGSVSAYDIAKTFLEFSGKYEQELRDADTVGRLRREFAGVVSFAYERFAM